MRNFARRAAVAVAGAITLGCVGVGTAAAADIPVPQRQAPAPEYYGEPQGYVQEGYYQPPPPVYVYPARPVYRYYAPPEVAVLPAPYWRRPAVVYGRPTYLARGPIRYGRYWHRGYRHW